MYSSCMRGHADQVLRVEFTGSDAPAGLRGEKNATLTYTGGPAGDTPSRSVTVWVRGLRSREDVQLLVERCKENVGILLRGVSDQKACGGIFGVPPLTADAVRNMVEVELAHLPGSRDGG